MQNHTYNWKRFWCPPDGRIDLSDRGGYLVDPDSEWGRYANRDVISFDAIGDTPCVVLLGEQGIGKTRTIESEAAELNRQLTDSTTQVALVNLNVVSGESSIYRELFDHPLIKEWEASDHELYLFIDSFDEAWQLVPSLPNLLLKRLEQFPRERLRLRIACRTGAWPEMLEAGLKNSWPLGGVKLYELAPLRRIDVIEVAQVNEFDPEAFMQEIDRVDVVPLASKPKTLDLLVREYRESGQLSSSQIELYRRGLRKLCEEARDAARPPSHRGVVGGQCYAVAERIAALTVFANCGVLRTADSPSYDKPAVELDVEDVSGGSERDDRRTFSVTDKLVGATLETSGLFTSRGSGRLGWAHQSYAEFLAASYIDRQGMTTPQVMSLLVHPDDSNGKLVPQLHGATAWLAGMRQDILEEVVRRDPEALLNGDVQMPENTRPELVTALLQLHEEGRNVDRGWSSMRRYQKLEHPGLAHQLQGCIIDKKRHQDARYVAIDVAQACRLQSLQEILVGVALDPTESIRIRINAAHAVAEIGDDEGRRRLKPLAIETIHDDEIHQLKAAALYAVWPDHISAEEAFAGLFPPNDHFSGLYEVFLGDTLVKRLPASGLPVALDWARGQMERGKLTSRIKSIIDDIMLKAIDHIDVPAVERTFSIVAPDWLRCGGPFFQRRNGMTLSGLLQEDTNRRRAVVASLVPLITTEDDLQELFDLATPHDTIWMLERLRTAAEPAARTWARLIAEKLDLERSSDVDAVLMMRDSAANSTLNEVFAPLFDAIPLDSTQAVQLRERYYRWKEIQRKWEQPSVLLEPPPAESIIECLVKVESGELAPWWNLLYYLKLDPYGQLTHHDFSADVTQFPSWHTAGSETRKRILDAAELFVRTYHPQLWEWIGTNQYILLDVAGYQALALLWRERKESLHDLPPETWWRWAPITVAFPIQAEDEEPQQHLAEMAYGSAPDEVIRAVQRLMDRESDYVHHHLRKLARCWDDRLGRILLEKARDSRISPHSMGGILEDLLDNGIDGARAYTESLLESSSAANETERVRAEVAARVLLTHTEDGGWTAVWPALQYGDPFSENVISAVAWIDHDASDVCKRLSEEQVADLYLWLADRYPHKDDPNPLGMHTVSQRERIGHWRDALLTHLRHRGTREAAGALRRIAQELPDLAWLKRVHAEAELITRQRTWQPPHPRQILQLAEDHRKRFVRSEVELLEVVIDSLTRLEERLQRRNPPLAIYLWDERHGCEPRDENRLSDFVKSHLDDDLTNQQIVLNREVENRRGEKTDIYVQAIVPDESNRAYPLIVVVEVKGCWHREVKTAMKTQLRDCYLHGSQQTHGLYLVGWFNCKLWNSEDYRKRQAPAWSLEDAQRWFDAQADALSGQGVRIKALVLDTSIR